MGWFTGNMFSDPALQSQLVEWTKTQPGYENWDGTPIPLTLEEDRKLIRDLNSYAQDPSLSAFDYQGMDAATLTLQKQTLMDQRDELLAYIDANPTMNGEQLTPGLNEIKARYKPIIDALNKDLENKYDTYWAKKEEPTFMDKLVGGISMAALSIGGGAMIGGIAADLGFSSLIDGVLNDMGISNLTGNAKVDAFLKSIPSSAVKNSALQLITTGEIDLEKLATGIGASGLNAYGMSLVSNLGLDPAIAKGLTSAVTGTVVGLAKGADFEDALTGGLITGAANAAGTFAGNTVKDALTPDPYGEGTLGADVDYTPDPYGEGTPGADVDYTDGEVFTVTPDDTVSGDGGLIDVTVTPDDAGTAVTPTISGGNAESEDFVVTDPADTMTGGDTSEEFVVTDPVGTDTTTGGTDTTTGGGGFGDILSPKDIGSIVNTVVGTVVGDVLTEAVTPDPENDTVPGGNDTDTGGLMAAGVKFLDPSLQNYTKGKRTTDWNTRRLQNGR